MARNVRPVRKVAKRKSAKPPSKALKYAFLGALVLMVFLAILFNYEAFLQPNNPVDVQDSSLFISFSFPLLVFTILLFRGFNLHQIIAQLGLSRDKLNFKMIGVGIALFGILLLVELAIGLFSVATGIPLPTNTNLAFSGAPLYILVSVFLITPFCEESLFRGFLVPRFGIILSALLFMILHSGYGSISELVGALAFGLIAGYIFKKTQSLYPSILGHALVNLVGVLLLQLLV